MLSLHSLCQSAGGKHVHVVDSHVPASPDSMAPRIDYASYLRSPRWKAVSTAAKERCDHRCYVCAYDWQTRGWGPLDTHHVDYSNLGHETFRDLACLCRSHHPKGAFSWEKLKMWRSSYRWRKRVAWIFRSVWSLTKLLARSIWRLVQGRARA